MPLCKQYCWPGRSLFFIVGARYTCHCLPSFFHEPFFLTHYLMVFVESQLCEELNVGRWQQNLLFGDSFVDEKLRNRFLNSREGGKRWTKELRESLQSHVLGYKSSCFLCKDVKQQRQLMVFDVRLPGRPLTPHGRRPPTRNEKSLIRKMRRREKKMPNSYFLSAG